MTCFVGNDEKMKSEKKISNVRNCCDVGGHLWRQGLSLMVWRVTKWHIYTISMNGDLGTITQLTVDSLWKVYFYLASSKIDTSGSMLLNETWSKEEFGQLNFKPKVTSKMLKTVSTSFSTNYIMHVITAIPGPFSIYCCRPRVTDFIQWRRDIQLEHISTKSYWCNRGDDEITYYVNIILMNGCYVIRSRI